MFLYASIMSIEYIQFAGFIFDNDNRECNIKATCYIYLYKGHYE